MLRWCGVTRSRRSRTRAGSRTVAMVCPITATTPFAVASVTKMVTVTTVLWLVDRGVVRLDQPLVEILPPAYRPTALTAEHTLHHLLSHTSGLANYHDDEDETWDSFTSCWDRIPTYHVRRPADMLPLFGLLAVLSGLLNVRTCRRASGW